MTELDAGVVWTFIAYIVLHVGMGVWLYRRNDGLDDFVLGGRSLSPGTAALSAQASDMSGWLLLGLPGAIYAGGLGASWIAVGLFVGTYLNWRFVAAPLRSHTERAGNALTLAAYFENRFEDRTKALRGVAALLTIVFFSLYVSSGLVAGGLLFQQLFGMDGTLSITVTVAVIIVYTFLGGFLAASYTDVIQGLLMLVALLIVPAIAIAAGGGFDTLTTAVAGRADGLMSLTQQVGFEDASWVPGEGLAVVSIISSLAWGFGYFGQPHILARFMGIRDVEAVGPARRIGTSWVFLTLGAAVLIGLAGIAFFDTPLVDQETVFLDLILETVPGWLAGVLLVAVLAAIMSTADSQLLVASSAVAEDVYRGFIDRDASAKRLLAVGRWTTVAIAVLAYLLALRGGSVLDLVGYAWAGFGAAFGPVVLLSLYWSKMTGKGALAAMLTGSVTVVVWRELVTSELYEMVPGVLAATAVAVVVSWLTTPPARDWSRGSGEPSEGRRSEMAGV